MALVDHFLEEARLNRRVDLAFGVKEITGSIYGIDAETVRIKKDDGNIATIAVETITYYEWLENKAPEQKQEPVDQPLQAKQELQPEPQKKVEPEPPKKDDYIEKLLRERNIELNSFEIAIQKGNRTEVQTMINNPDFLMELGYTQAEIERSKKAFKVTNWDMNWYGIAGRFYSLQVNKNGIAELYYEAAATQTDKESEEYQKIMNALATIKGCHLNEEYVTFFEKNRAYLLSNTFYIKKYASALVKTKHWDHFDRYMDVFEAVFKDSPEMLQRLKDEANRERSLPDFVLNEYPQLLARTLSEKTANEKEKEWIKLLPDREAMHNLLSLYFREQMDYTYFELVNFALPYIANDKTAISMVATRLRETTEIDWLRKLLPRIPVLWCDYELIMRYRDQVSSEEIQDKEQALLWNFLQKTGTYQPLNRFEQAIVQKDVEGVLEFIQNPSSLEELGYSEEEIEEMPKPETLESFFKYEFDRVRLLLAFQKNKNHSAERYFFDAFYVNKWDVVNRLFPLFLTERRGEMVVAIYSFNREMQSDTSPKKRPYYQALCQVEEDDKIIYEELKDRWKDYADDEILKRLLTAAESQNDEMLATELRSQISISRVNEFEEAITSGEIEKIRSFVVNAEKLLELGYTPEEIQKIKNQFELGSNNAGKENIQIASRIYLYQKNKNNLAEKYFWDTVATGDETDKAKAYKFLYQIYSGQNNYEWIVKIYEDALDAEVEKKFNPNYASSYVNALFELKKFDKFQKYLKTYKEQWTNFNYGIELLYCGFVLDLHELDDYAKQRINPNAKRSELFSAYLIRRIEKDSLAEYEKDFISFFNQFFTKFSIESMKTVIQNLKGYPSEDLEAELLGNREKYGVDTPGYKLIAALADSTNRQKYLWLWWTAVREDTSTETGLQNFLYLDRLFPENKNWIVENAMDLYFSRIEEDGATEAIYGLSNYISANLTEESQKNRWIEAQKSTLSENRNSFQTLEIYLNQLGEPGIPEQLWEAYLAYLKEKNDLVLDDQLFHFLEKFYRGAAQSLPAEKNKQVLREMLRLAGRTALDETSINSLSDFCRDAGMDFESRMLRKTEQGENLPEEALQDDEEEGTYTEVLLDIFAEIRPEEYAENYRIISRKIQLSEDEEEYVSGLKFKKENERWSDGDIEILSKALLRSPTNGGYYQMLFTALSDREELKNSITESLIYGMIHWTDMKLEGVLELAGESGLVTLAIELINEMLDTHKLSNGIAAQKRMRVFVADGWGEKTEFCNAVPEILHKMAANVKNGDSDDNSWNTLEAAVDIASATNQYEALLREFESWLAGVYGRQCTVVLANMLLSGNTELADKVMNLIDHSSDAIKYEKCVGDIYRISKERPLEEHEKIVLRMVTRNNGNLLGVRDFLDTYAEIIMEGKREQGISAVQFLLQYESDDAALYEIGASLLLDNKSLEDHKTYYEYVYNYIQLMGKPDAVKYYVGQMMCGERYLLKERQEIKPFAEMIKMTYPDMQNMVSDYENFSKNLESAAESADCRDFVSIILRGIFTGDLRDVIFYNMEDHNINQFLSENLAVGNTNMLDLYYRSILKSIIRFLIDYRNDEAMIEQGDNRLCLMFKKLNLVGCSYDFLKREILSLSDGAAQELRKLFDLDIENYTICHTYLGKYALMSEYAIEYAHIFSAFIGSANYRMTTDIFRTQAVTGYIHDLSKKDRTRADILCKRYEELYLKSATDPEYPLIQPNPNYELNVFSNHLRHKGLDDFSSFEQRYLRFKKKYDLICKLYGVENAEDVNGERFDYMYKRTFFSLRAIYLYYAILSGHMEDSIVTDQTEADFINTVIIAVSHENYSKDLSTFMNMVSYQKKKVIGYVVLAEQGDMDDVAMRTLEEDDAWTPYICSYLILRYGRPSEDNYAYVDCRRIVNTVLEGKSPYWIKDYVHSNTLDLFDADLYLEKIREMEAEASEEELNVPRVQRTIEVDKEPENIEEIEENEKNPSEDEVEVADEKSVEPKIPSVVTETGDFQIPEYVQIFLSNHQEDGTDGYELFQNWKNLEERNMPSEERERYQRSLSIKIGDKILSEQKDALDERLMCQMFSLATKNSHLDVMSITSLHSIFRHYICDYSDLDLLSDSIMKNHSALECLCIPQSENPNSRTEKDIAGVAELIRILINIASDVKSDLESDTIRDRLSAYRIELAQQTKTVSSVRQISSALSKLILEKVDEMNSVPRLVVTHTGNGMDDSLVGNRWKERLCAGATGGMIRGVVINQGNVSAYNVKLTVHIIPDRTEVYQIDEIRKGERLPFKLEYSEEDIFEEKVTWDATVTYSDTNDAMGGEYNATTTGEVLVTRSDEPWEFDMAGRHCLNPQPSATGGDFFGRTEELNRLNSLYDEDMDQTQYPSLLITGLKRAGKTSIIKKFAEQLRARGDMAVVFVDGQSINGSIDKAFYDRALEDIYSNYRKTIDGYREFSAKWSNQNEGTDWIGSLPTYFMEMSELLGDRKIIFILDEMENVFYSKFFSSSQEEEQFFGMIRALIQNYQQYVSFIFCGSDRLLISCIEQKRESQLFQVLQRIQISRMGISDVQELFDHYNETHETKFGKTAVNRIMYYTNGLIWHIKILAYNVLNRVIDEEHVIRSEIVDADVDQVMELLIRGDLGKEAIDLLDKNFGPRRRAIIRAMAYDSVTYEESVSVDTMLLNLEKMNYIDEDTGEAINSILEEELLQELIVLEKMGFIERDQRRERSFRFTTELYRILLSNHRVIKKFIMLED